MPTELQQNAAASNSGTQQVGAMQQPAEAEQQQTQQLTQAQQDHEDRQNLLDKMEFGKEVTQLNGEMSSSQTSTTSSTSLNGSISNGSGRKSSLISPDPTPYVTKARVTRPTPPPPSYNPMQFVQIKPCNLYQTAQQQLKKAEEVKKIKEIKKEEPEDWQNNLDNWKSSRRKRVEHIIDRVVEVKKLELEEHDRSRRKSKTFSEMIEERGERGGARGLTKLASLAVYNEDESNDFSDLGIGTSSASGKSSLSEDYDNHSVTSDNAELDKAIFENKQKQNSVAREYISSPGYDTSSSTAPASSPDPCEYTYEGAIQDYKQRVSRATNNAAITANSYKFDQQKTHTTQVNATAATTTTKTTTAKSPSADGYKNGQNDSYPVRRGSKIEDRLSGFEVTSPSDTQENAENKKVDVPKIDITKRKEIFEQQQQLQKQNSDAKPLTNGGSNGIPKVTLRDRFKFDANAGNETQQQQAAKKEVKRLSGDITSIKERLQSLEQQKNALANGSSAASGSEVTISNKPSVDVPVASLKDRLSSLQNAVAKEEVRKPPVALIDARQLEIMKSEEEKLIKQQQQQQQPQEHIVEPTIQLSDESKPTMEPVDRDDSGIHTADDIDTEVDAMPTATLVPEQAAAEPQPQMQNEQLSAAIAALALEEQQLEQAANAVNQIEAEFAELITAPPTAAVAQQKRELPQQPPTQPQPNAPTATATATATATFNNLDFSVSDTNKLALKNLNENHELSGNGSIALSVVDRTVAGTQDSLSTPTATTTNLRRKPSNEMVHARNLLKIFKETFQNDIELDEAEEEETATQLPAQTPSNVPGAHAPQTNIESAACAAQAVSSNITRAPGTPTMIPRSINLATKPPVAPKDQHLASARQMPPSPITSPIAQRKETDGQFSINGRVEIFNSKHMLNQSTAGNSLPQVQRLIAPPHSPTSNTAHLVSHLPTARGEISSNHTQLAPATKPIPKAPMSPVTAHKPLVANPSHASSAAADSAVVIGAPPVTILDPAELPKPNTVKALSSCFTQEPAAPAASQPPKPLPRSRIPVTPPQSPTPAKRSLCRAAPVQKQKSEIVLLSSMPSGGDMDCLAAVELRDKHAPLNKTASLNSNASNASSLSTDSTTSVVTVIETKAIVHSEPTAPAQQTLAADPLQPNDTLSAIVTMPSEMPPLLLCAPNESSLYKLASSAPQSPVSADTTDSATYGNLFACLNLPPPLTPPAEKQCERLDVRNLPADKQVPATSCVSVSGKDCGDYVPAQLPVKEATCKMLRIERDQPLPATPCQDIELPAKANGATSPILAARAAHSKALIDTCEKIIAEEKQVNNQLKSMLPGNECCSPKQTPKTQRKSKIPKPISCCTGAAGSISKADYDNLCYTPVDSSDPPDTAEGPLIARMHVVETQIKVTTTTPPQSPKVKHSPAQSPVPAHKQQQTKKTKNIFDFLRKNFGQHDEKPSSAAVSEATPTETQAINEPVIVLPAPVLDTVTFDEVIRVDNSKFYVPTTSESVDTQLDDLGPPPPLPKSPIPVNIELTKTIRTDEILEASNSQQNFSQEVNAMLDEEMSKLNDEVKRMDQVENTTGAANK